MKLPVLGMKSGIVILMKKEAEGTCEIDDHVLPCTMQASTTGLHEIRFYFQIAGEEIIRTIHVAVGKT